MDGSVPSRPTSLPAAFFERDGPKATAYVVANAALVLLPGIVAWHIGQWWAYLIAFVCVGARGQACYILQHEAMHGLLYPTRKSNELIGIFLSAMLGTRFYLGRRLHMDHHKLVGTPQDPNEAFHGVEQRPPGWPAVRYFLFHLLGGRLIALVRGLLGLNAGSTVPAAKVPRAQGRIDLVALFSMQAVLFIAMTAVSSPIVYFALYVLPLSTLTAFLEALRSFSEHVVPGHAHESEAERRRCFFTDGPRWELFFISPFDFHYHHIHHMLPNVATFRVRSLHRWLESNDPDFGARFMTRLGYVATALRYITNRPFAGCGQGYPKTA